MKHLIPILIALLVFAYVMYNSHQNGQLSTNKRMTVLRNALIAFLSGFATCLAISLWASKSGGSIVDLDTKHKTKYFLVKNAFESPHRQLSNSDIFTDLLW